jgi:hypothetical protein
VTGTDLATASSISFAGVTFTPGTPAAGVNEFSVTGGAITLYSPEHIAGPFPVTVTNVGGTSSPVDFTYYAVPAVASISPDQGPIQGGQDVVISGDGLEGATAVDFGGTAYYPAGDPSNPAGAPTFTQDANGDIHLSTPAAPNDTAGPVDVTVTTPGGTSDPIAYETTSTRRRISCSTRATARRAGAPRSRSRVTT